MPAPLVLLVSLAFGSPPTAGTGSFAHGVDLRWRGVEGCPEPREIADVPDDADEREPDRGLLIASLRRRADERYELELVLFDGRQAQVRRATAVDCETLVETVVLVARTWVEPTFAMGTPGLASDPALTVQRPSTAPMVVGSQPVEVPRPSSTVAVPPQPEPEPEPEPEPRRDASRVPIEQPPPAPPPARRRRAERAIAFGLRADAMLGGNLIAPFEGGLAGTFSLWVRGFRAEFGGAHLFGRDRVYAPAAPASIRVSASFATLRLCGQPRWHTLAFPLCVGADLGVMQGRGRNVPQATTERRIWPAVVGGAAIGWSVVRHLALVVGAEVVVAAARPSFTFRDALDTVFTAGQVGGRARVGIEVQF